MTGALTVEVEVPAAILQNRNRGAESAVSRPPAALTALAVRQRSISGRTLSAPPEEG